MTVRLSISWLALKREGERIMLQLFATAVGELQRALSDAFNPYRPELHYMRGPGPACRAKAYYSSSLAK